VFFSRNLIAILVIASLVASDVVTYLHGPSCCTSHATACVSHSSSTESAGCSHTGNPFKKRWGAKSTGQAVESNQLAQGSTCDPSCDVASDGSNSEHSSAPHDSSNCSLCRWLITARIPIAVNAITIEFELSPLSSVAMIPWVEPAQPSRLQDVSRRGPPVSPFFA
jgi:hypothetical protein